MCYVGLSSVCCVRVTVGCVCEFGECCFRMFVYLVYLVCVCVCMYLVNVLCVRNCCACVCVVCLLFAFLVCVVCVCFWVRIWCLVSVRIRYV